MNGGRGPSPDYMARLSSTLGPAPMPRPAPAAGAPPDFAAQAGGSLGVAPERGVIDNAALTQGGFSVAPPGAGPFPPPLAAGAPSPAPPLPPQAFIGPPNDAPPPPRPFLERISLPGVVNRPARETEMRGPSLLAAQSAGNAGMAAAIPEVVEREKTAALNEYIGARVQEEKALAREQAAMDSSAQRANELAERQADFEASTKAIAKQSVDPNRFWANASTGSKIASFIAIAMGGFVQGMRGGSNTGMDAVNTMIDRDVRAQELAFAAQRDAHNAKQTAFSLAMQKYGSVDTARSVARAAALDAASMQVAQQSALWKTTDAANRGNKAQQELMDRRTQQVAQGMAYQPAATVGVGGSWRDPRTGMVMTDAQAQKQFDKSDERAFEIEKQDRGVAGDILKDQAKGAKGPTASELGTETRAISSQLQQAGVPQARAAAETALKALNDSPGGKGEALFRATTPDTIGHVVAGDKANAREQAYSKFSNAAVKAIMGNATEAERARMVEDLGRASDPESRRRAIQNVLTDLEAIEKNAHAGGSPEAQEAFKERRTKAEGAPPNAPKGSKAGW